jgi:hypothetical protein
MELNVIYVCDYFMKTKKKKKFNFIDEKLTN